MASQAAGLEKLLFASKTEKLEKQMKLADSTSAVCLVTVGFRVRAAVVCPIENMYTFDR